MCFTRREATESIALLFLVLLFLFLSIRFRLAFVGLAFLFPLRLVISKRVLRFVVCPLNMPLSEHDSRLMFYQTDGMDRIGFFLFKLQSSSVCFSINRDGTGSSFLLVLLKEVGPHYPVVKHKTPLRRRTLGRFPAVLTGSACVFDRPGCLGGTQGGGAMR